MKKVPYILGTIGLLALGLVILASCSNPTDSSSDDAGGRGVIGSISGMVYDTTTAMPIAGVGVKVGKHSTTTDTNGTWALSGVEPGTYTVTYHKDGYLIYSEEAFVDPTEYTKQDPFMEKEALKKQLNALTDWVNAGNLPAHPTFNTDNQQYSWTYQDGVWVNGTGSVVEVTNDNGTFNVTIQEGLKLDYTFNYAYSLRAIGLNALTGTAKGQLKVFYVTKDNESKAKHTDAKTILEGVKFYFTIPDHMVGDYDDAGSPPADVSETTDIEYGPVTTDANGNFSFTGLPVNTGLTIKLESFTQEGWYFKPGSDAYTYEGNTFVKATDPTATPPRAIYAAKGTEDTTETGETVPNANDTGVYYLFTEGSYAVVTDYVTDVSGGDVMTLTFNKAMDSATFAATLKIIDDNTLHMANNDTVTLSASWNAEKTVVTLFPAKAPNDEYVKAVFPYSLDKGISIGQVDITAGSKAQDGGILLNEDIDLPVFTAEAIRLVDIDFNPVNIQPRAVVSKEAVKLIFSKPVNPTAMFMWGDTAPQDVAEYAIDPSDAKNFFVYTDMLKNGEKKYLYAYVASAIDPSDYFGDDPLEPTTKLVTIDFTKAPVALMTPVKTNIYDERTDTAQERAGATANFPVNSPITLTFAGTIPSDANVRAILVRDDGHTSSLTFDKTSSENKDTYKELTIGDLGSKILTLTPVSSLLYGEKYYLAVEITNADGQKIFGFDGSGDYDKELFNIEAAVDNAVTFTTALDSGNLGLMLESTNIYSNRTSLLVTNADANFPVGDTLTLTFASAIPDDAVVKPALVTEDEPATFDNDLIEKSIAFNVTYSTDRKTLFIDPAADLKYDSAYYLALEISKDGTWLFGGNGKSGSGDGYTLFTPVSGNKIAEVGSKDRSIVFTTAPSKLKLASTNLYAVREPANYIGLYTDVDNFPFAVDGPITLTFTEDLPADTIVKAALVKSAATNFSSGDGFDTSIAMTSSFSGKILSLTPDVPLDYDTTYYLRLKLDIKIDNVNTETIFAPTAFDSYNEQMVIYDDESDKESISFKTKEEYPVAEAIASGTGSSTSAEFDSFSDGNVDVSSSLVLGKMYYVQFDRKLEHNFAATYEASTNGTDINPALTITLSKHGDYILGIKVTSNVPNTPYSNVQIAANASTIGSIGGTLTSPKFKSSDGNLKINLQTVNAP